MPPPHAGEAHEACNLIIILGLPAVSSIPFASAEQSEQPVEAQLVTHPAGREQDKVLSVGFVIGSTGDPGASGGQVLL